MTDSQHLHDVKIVGYDINVRHIPIRTPYKLSFVNLSSFDTVIARLRTDLGEELVGEVVPLPGYADETLQDVETACRSWRSNIVGKRPSEIRAWLKSKASQQPSAASLIYGTLDALHARARNWAPHFAQPVPLVFAISATDGTSIEQRTKQALHEGYRTLKCKVGQCLDQDLEVLDRLQSILPPSIQVRLDANQGWDLEQARIFFQAASSLPKGMIELIEQPLGISKWDETSALCSEFNLPIMLDESIHTLSDIERAAQIGCASIKLKLCKQGDLSQVLRMARHARTQGLGTVFGNGVATDISNLLELRLFDRYRSLFQGACESTGFAKLTSPLQEKFLTVVNGCAVWKQGRLGTFHSHV